MIRQKENSMALNIRYDFNGLTSERIGEHGVRPEEIAALKPRLEAAHQAVGFLRKNKTLGFFDLPYDQTLVREIEALAKKLRKFEHFVVIGIGGSALGNIALQTALRHPYYNELSYKARGKTPAMHFPDNIDPDRLKGLLDVLDLKKTVFNIISKSGDTVEGMSTFMWLHELMAKEVGKKKLKKHFVLTTDRKAGSLRKIADAEGFDTLPIPGNVGGRFSVMTAVGLLSAAVSGINIRQLLAGAAAMDAVTRRARVEKNPALMGAAYHYLQHTARNKNIQIMMPYSHALKDVADWFRQLWAESLGKAVNRQGQTVHVGQTPCKSVGVTDQHSQVQLYAEGPYDKVITFLTVDRFRQSIKIPKIYGDIETVNYLGGHTINELFQAEMISTELALQKTGRPTCAIRLPEVNPATVGGLLFLLELQTAYIGELYDINAFDQPGVEQGKHYAYGLMGRKGYEAKAAEVAAAPKPNSDFVVAV
jgi:glucose-6-phosphate isomerase